MNKDTLDEQVARMTLREKIGQTCQAQFSEVYARAGGDLSGYFGKFPVGSLFAGQEVIGGREFDAEVMRDALLECQRASHTPLSVAGDLESGAGSAIRGMTKFPRLMALGATGSTELAYQYGRLTALEARKVGFDWNFGPVADLYYNWLNPALGPRCLGQRPEEVIPLLNALVRGYQDHGIAATAKHFPGDGVDFRDQHLCTTINSLDEQTWRATFGQVYAELIQNGVRAIMAGHIALPWQDALTGRGRRPIPATLSRPILTELLREEMEFKGIVVSDALIMAGITSWASWGERTIEAFNAGIDVMLWPGEQYFDLMTWAVENQRVSMARLDESVRRILAFKAQLHPDGNDDAASAPTSACPLPEAKSFAHKLAASSLTLERNRLGILPFPTGKIRSVFILYASARPAEAERRIELLVGRLKRRGIAVESQINGNCLDIVKRESEGMRYDAFLCLFDQQMHDLKNTMRPTGEMAECMWTLQNTETLEPVLISLGSPYLLKDLPYADTMINAYSADDSVLEALEAALFGEAPFVGRCPVDGGGDGVLHNTLQPAAASV